MMSELRYYAVGMGCERGCELEDVGNILKIVLDQANITLMQILSINSLDIKADEVALLTLAEQSQTPFHTYSVSALKRVEQWLSCRSDYVFRTVGLYGVAESAALYALVAWAEQQGFGGVQPSLLVPKQIGPRATCALAELKLLNRS